MKGVVLGATCAPPYNSRILRLKDPLDAAAPDSRRVDNPVATTGLWCMPS